MYFKSLELIGFKSFAEKTKLNFEPGVTAVVGPNGCGKSNVADSIRWVLGEQSAKSLRASSMQDVIFNGTDNKEPINFAEVSLTFSNENRALPIDYDEVTITRRIFRSGESEYLLNKTPVRLKDISDLLMGTGIGTESYSIIEQGKMDMILSSKPEDRRYVFEEASGITKYKAKKKEALRKLEQTEQNLLRINDIITEVKRQIASIERQAKKAERYKIDFEKLKEMEIKLSFTEYKSLKTQEATYTVESDDTRAREKELSACIAEIASNIEAQRRALNDFNNKMTAIRSRISEMSNLLDMNKHKIEVNRERIAESIELQDGLRKEVESIAEKIGAEKALVESLKSDLDKAASGRAEKQKAVSEREAMLVNIAREIEETESRVKEFKVRIVDYLAKETKIKNDLIKIGADIQNRKARQRRLEIEKGDVAKELESAEKALSEVLLGFKTIENKVLALRQELESKRRASEEALSAVKTIELEIAKEDNKRSALLSKIEMLEESLKTYEGFKNGVRSILLKSAEGEALFSGILGALANIVKVDRGYEEAVSVLLGDDAQLIITETESDALRAVEYLNANSLGKACFLSLESLRNRPNEAAARGISSDRVTLRNFVKADTKFEIVLDYFFGDAYLVDSLGDGMGVSGRHASRFVTKTGQMVDGCKVLGGSSGENSESMLIGRRERLEELKAELRMCEEKVLSLGGCRAEKERIGKALQAEIISMEAGLHQEDINLANARTKKDAQGASVQKLKDELFLLDSELEEVNQMLEELTARGESLNSELNAIEAEKSSMQDFIDQSQNLISEKNVQRQNITLEMATLRAEAQSLEKEEESVRNNLRSHQTLLFEFEDTIYSKETLLKETSEKIKTLEEEIAKLLSDNDAISSEMKTISEESSAVEGERADLVLRLSMDEVRLKENEARQEALRNQIRDIDVKLTELNFKKTNLKDKILQAYKVDLETAHLEIEENIDWEAIKAQVAELKDKLDKMGPVNLVAIDEHKELEERNNFLIHQQEDLVNAKDSLMKAIQKINKTTKEQFIDTFRKIQVEFKNFFRMLFGGGQAELVLIDEQDILESGIEIIVRPPGKKLQNLMLLSGGEKALTACALLFAIFKVKPSPFCVLDELDAPLDESNVVRFASVLREFVKMSQFIIITHNKRTMELADVIYGITMQERGVSKIVSVKFLDEKKKTQAETKSQQTQQESSTTQQAATVPA
ncbi:MAG: chromosome segregation protein SMC [Candidatus Omnitrophica bacterium]|nr:chromosome segregation protein SMC [Candidatus Omnitrophota bacterium]